MDAKTIINIQKYLSGLEYPATKDEIIEFAKNGSADQEAIDMLDMLPQKDYRNSSDILSELEEDSEEVE
jgi:hypothetical protein